MHLILPNFYVLTEAHTKPGQGRQTPSKERARGKKQSPTLGLRIDEGWMRESRFPKAMRILIEPNGLMV